MPRTFAVAFDYLCPFARNANLGVAAGLDEGMDWQVRFVPYSLSQGHLADDAPPVWEGELDDLAPGVLALAWGLHLRDEAPDRFLPFHVAVFDARHRHGLRIDDPEVLGDIGRQVGLSPASVDGDALERSLKTLAVEHGEAVETWNVWGVPTFMVGDRASFVRLMEPAGSAEVERVLDLLDWSQLNEFKHTRVHR